MGTCCPRVAVSSSKKPDKAARPSQGLQEQLQGWYKWSYLLEAQLLILLATSPAELL